MRSSTELGASAVAMVDCTVSSASAFAVLSELQRERGGDVRGAPFDGQIGLISPPQRLPIPHAVGGFAGVVHDEHGEAVLSLQSAQ